MAKSVTLQRVPKVVHGDARLTKILWKVPTTNCPMRRHRYPVNPSAHWDMRATPPANCRGNRSKALSASGHVMLHGSFKLGPGGSLTKWMRIRGEQPSSK